VRPENLPLKGDEVSISPPCGRMKVGTKARKAFYRASVNGREGNRAEFTQIQFTQILWASPSCQKANNTFVAAKRQKTDLFLKQAMSTNFAKIIHQ